MNLVGYTATALSRNDITDTPTDKNVVSGAIVELKTLEGDLVTIYDDASGANPETQKTCDSDGQCEFYAEEGDYNLEINGKVNKVSLFFNKDKVNDIAAWGERFVGYFVDGFTYTKADDVAKGVDGKYYSYGGASAYPVVVIAGAAPSVPEYTPVVLSDANAVSYIENINVENALRKRSARYEYAEISSVDLAVGQYVVITDFNNALYRVVDDTDAGGYYRPYKAGFKLRLSEQNPTTKKAGMLLDGSLTDIGLMNNLLNIYKSVGLSGGVYPPYNFTQDDLTLRVFGVAVFTLPPNTVSSSDTNPVSALEFSGDRITVFGNLSTNGNSLTNDSSGYNLSNRRGELHISGDDVKIYGEVNSLDSHYVGISLGNEIDTPLRTYIGRIVNHRSVSYIVSFWSCLEWEIGSIVNKDLVQGFDNRVYTGNQGSSTKVAGMGYIGSVLGRGTYCVYEVHTEGVYVGYMDVAGWKSEGTKDLTIGAARSISTSFDAWGFGVINSANFKAGSITVDDYQGSQPRAVQISSSTGSIDSLTVDNNQSGVSCEVFTVADGFHIGNIDLNGRNGTATGLRLPSGFTRHNLTIGNLNSRGHTGLDAEIAVYDPENIKLLNVNEDININSSYNEVKRRNAYREGTDLVQLSAGAGSITVAADNDTLSWTQVGRDVTIKGRLIVSSVSGASGSLSVTGIDRTPLDLPDASGEASVTLYVESLSGSPSGIIQGVLSEGASSISITRYNNGSSVDDVSTYLQAGSRIILNCTYSV